MDAMASRLAIFLCLVLAATKQGIALELRLVDGSTSGQGRVEVRWNATDPWGTVCDDLWDNRDATVVCRMLGYKWGDAAAYLEFNTGSGSIHMDNVQCTGTETNLGNCNFNGWDIHNCIHNEDAGVKCTNNSVTIDSNPQVDRADVGVVNLRTLTGSLSICDSQWDNNDARVACRDAGFRDGRALTGSALSRAQYSWYSAYSQSALTNFTCTGSETSLASCGNTTISRCPTGRLASVVCYNTDASQIPMGFSTQITNGTNSWGMVQVRYMGKWGQVCSPGWDDKAARVFCRQSGFLSGGGIKYGKNQWTNFLPIWISTGLNCTGNKTSLEQCFTSGTWGAPVWWCNDPAYVLCYSSSTPPRVSLSLGDHGLVQITYDGQTGTVCDNSWSQADADVLCGQLGYQSGTFMGDSYYGQGTGTVFMDGLQCNSNDGSLLKCHNNGWQVVDATCSAHTQDASVACFSSQIKLINGDHLHGVVTVKQGTTFRVQCGIGFDDTDAAVVCRELGFSAGRALAQGAYGRVSNQGSFVRRDPRCLGNETHFANCSASTSSCYDSTYRNYAAVACNNGSFSTESSVALTGGHPDFISITGRVVVTKDGIRGRICDNYWDNRDANATCRQLGFAGGVSYQYNTQGIGPYIFSEVLCNGTESSLFGCNMGNESCSDPYYSAEYDAGVLCYRTSAPSLRLVGGGASAGRVEVVTDDGTAGTICSSSYSVANIVCRQLGFREGQIVSDFGSGVGPVLASIDYCQGQEDTIFMCPNNGWRQPQGSDCLNHQRDLGVRCYKSVRLYYGSMNASVAYGWVMYYYQNSYRPLCSYNFTANTAQVVCRELGFAYGRSLPVGSYSYYTTSNFAFAPACAGTESDMDACPGARSVTMGTCPSPNNIAGVVCSNTPINPSDFAITVDTSRFPALVNVQMYGLTGTICNSGWDDNEARVICRSQGYVSGVAFGAGSYYYNSQPMLMTEFNCNGTERRLNDCPFSTNLTSACNNYYSKARVLCFNTGFGIRLGGSDTDYSGRVELSFEGQWGQICDYGFNDADANVVCRQMGFTGGSASPRSTFQAGPGTYWLYYPRCLGNETDIWSCPNSGFNVTYTFCSNSYYVAGVRCSGRVRLQPNDQYGAVQVTNGNGGYGLVCSDNFTDVEAGLVCEELGYSHGISLCCNAFGYFPGTIIRSKIRCLGNEMSVVNCPYETSLTYCPSRDYASAACSNTPPSSGYTVEIEGDTNSNKVGRVKIKYMDIWGYICPNGFDDNDAMAICREKGFLGGMAYSRYSYTNRWYMISDVRWLSNLQCTGRERYLHNCPNIVFGNIDGCNSYSDAAVYCYENTGPQFRLVNGTATAGRIEVAVDGVWGTVCQSYMSNTAAETFCKHLNFTGGRALPSGTFGPGTGPITISSIYCSEGETTLSQCDTLWGSDTASYCNNHIYDASIQCFGDVRLYQSGSHDYGRVEMRVGGNWTAVCDTNFDDRAAKLVCTELGFVDGKRQCCSALGDLAVSDIGVTLTSCPAGATSLSQCTYSTTGVCSSKTYVSVLCSNTTIVPSTPQVRLAQRSSYYFNSGTYYGPIEVNVYGTWGPVCDVGWTDKEASVACKMLGFTGGVAYYGSFSSAGPMLVGGFSCTGNENNLGNCAYKGISDDIGCRYSMVYTWGYLMSRNGAGVLCYNGGSAGIRLAGGGPRDGRVEILFRDTWGKLCDYYWTDTEATVVCKQLGFAGGSNPRTDSWSSTTRYAQSTLNTTWMSYASCQGNEKSIFQCYNTWYGRVSTSCLQAEVVCYDNIRLVNGDEVTAGVVEVNINNNWGSVCDTNWGDEETAVTCRNMGFERGFFVCCGAYGNHYTPVADKVVCTGSEQKLSLCSHDVPATRNCMDRTVAVACYNGTPADTLVWTLGGGNNYTGEVLLTFLNLTGRICADDWDDVDAGVACRELGYSKGHAYNHNTYSYFYGSYSPYWTSNVNCTGNERTLSECPRARQGSVKTCTSGYSAGLLCASSTGFFYSIGGGSDSSGRAEVTVDGTRGTICRSYWDSNEAKVFCKSLGFRDGESDYTTTYTGGTGPVYAARFSCTGKESSLEDCPHQGWVQAASSDYYCSGHRNDATVKCYNDVRLANYYSSSPKQGPVQVFFNDSWGLVCDTNFDDRSARRVCQDLGFVDGRALCCSAYGYNYFYGGGNTLLNMTMECDGSEKDASQCLKTVDSCSSGFYASVTCFNASEQPTEMEGYSFQLEDPTGDSGRVVVTHYGVRGHICSSFWTDTEAKVFCRSQGFPDGLSYHTDSDSYLSVDQRGPYWISAVNCTGNEASLARCSFGDRKTLGNCSDAHLASVTCVNGSIDVQYRLAGGAKNYGRVEVAVGGVWGTICDSYWDDREAGVLCRQLNFTDGYALGRAYYGQGTGPIWLSRLTCTGTETSLHKCPHAGFNSEVVDSDSGYPWYYYYNCNNHIQDASVFCIDKVRLNIGLNASLGAVEVFQDGSWQAVCDVGFGQYEAQTVCLSLGFRDGKPITGSKFGKTTGPIGISSVSCGNTKNNLFSCSITKGKTCSSGSYAGVYCSRDTIIDTGFSVSLLPDDTSSNPANYHGFLQVTMQGMQGAVCAATFDQQAAKVACRQLGFAGGVPYTPYRSYLVSSGPQAVILMSDFRCTGNEQSLDACAKVTTPNAWCDYYAPRAGLLCYHSTTSGVSYRVTGGSDATTGRLEMSFDGEWRSLCSAYYTNGIGMVGCKNAGFKAGLAMAGGRFAVSPPKYWLTGLNCRGNESSITECGNYGFDKLSPYYYYYYTYDPCATSGPVSVRCLDKEPAFTDIRLVDGTNSSGRLEVYMTGLEEWGTVCDDYWTDTNAGVVCRQLGFATGKATMYAEQGTGSGHIFMDDVNCKGNESKIWECAYPGYGVHNCLHHEDAGVECTGVYVPPTSASPVTDGPEKEKLQGGSTNAAAIAVPVVLVLAAIGVGMGVFYYRRYYRAKTDFLSSGLVEDASSVPGESSTGISFTQRAVRFLRSERPAGGVSNPTYENVEPSSRPSASSPLRTSSLACPRTSTATPELDCVGPEVKALT